MKIFGYDLTIKFKWLSPADPDDAIVPFNPSNLKLGRPFPSPKDPRTLRFANYVLDLPEPPASVNYGVPVKVWGMLANDRMGNCVLPGTKITSPNINRAYMAQYEGDIIRIALASGKQLAVTANHPVFTPRGAVQAKTIKKGDYLVGTSGPEVFPDISARGGKAHVNLSPTLAEEIFSSLSLSRGAIMKIVPTAIDLHGDGEFVDGNINIVTADSSLWGKFNAALRKPHAQTQISPTSELQSFFHCLGAALKRGLFGLSAFLGDMGLSNERLSLGFAHTGITQPNCLTKGPQFVSGVNNGAFKPASRNPKFLSKFLASFARNVPPDSFGNVSEFSVPGQSIGLAVCSKFKARSLEAPRDGVVTDTKFIGDLLDAFPGIVAPECVVNVEIEHYSGPVYDFGTKQGWYIADGALVHNCTCAGILHAIQLWLANNSFLARFTDDDAINLYRRLCGYVPGRPETDQGGIELDILKAWRKEPIAGCELLGFAAVDPKNWEHVKLAHWLSGSLYMGVNLPLSAQKSGLWADTSGTPGEWGGHCMITSAYNEKRGLCSFFNSKTLTAITWGREQNMTAAWVAKYCDELWVPITSAWFDKAGRAPNGFDLGALLADVRQLSLTPIN